MTHHPTSQTPGGIPVCTRDSRRMAGMAVMLGLWLATLAFAASEQPRQFDLPSDTADKSLKRFSEQAGVEVIYPSQLAKGINTRAVKGSMAPRDALEAMLAGTGLPLVREPR